MLQECRQLDAVSVIVPNKFHAPLALQVLEPGSTSSARSRRR